MCTEKQRVPRFFQITVTMDEERKNLGNEATTKTCEDPSLPPSALQKNITGLYQLWRAHGNGEAEAPKEGSKEEEPRRLRPHLAVKRDKTI